MFYFEPLVHFGGYDFSCSALAANVSIGTLSEKQLTDSHGKRINANDLMD